MKVYVVSSSHGEYEDYRERIEKIFDSREKAENFTKEFNSVYIVSNSDIQKYNLADELYNSIMDEMYKEGWDWGDNNDSYAKCEQELVKRFEQRSELSYEEFLNIGELITYNYYPATIYEYEVE